jgi:hypothetical protein
MPPVRAVADDGHDEAAAPLRVAPARQPEGGRYAVRVAEGGRGVRVLDQVVGRFLSRGIAGEPAFLLELGEAVAPAGDELVDICLVPGVEKEDVLGRVEHPVQRHRQLHDAEVRTEMSAVLRDGLHYEVPDLPRELVALGKRERLQIGG